jgi:hypothetical protein
MGVSKRSNIIAYTLITILVVWIAISEWRDNNCDDAYVIVTSCKGDGRNTRGSSSPDDTPNQILSNIEEGAKSEEDSIKWRRALIVSYITSLLISVTVCSNGSLIEWPRFLTCMVIVWAAIYFTMNFYSAHVSSVISKNIGDSIQLLKNKIQ